MERSLFGVKLVALAGDITRQQVDAVVNAANSSLMGGGGVDGAIRRAGGPAIQQECQRIVAERGPLPPGEAVATTAGRLPARHVIHTVGPIWRGGGHGEAEVLRRCYQSCLRLAEELGAASVAFPAISTGAYGYPPDQAATVAVQAVVDYLAQRRPDGTSRLQEVRFVLFSQQDLQRYEELLSRLGGEGSGDAGALQAPPQP